MGGDVDTIKERIGIAELVGGYVKLEKAGQSLKARCPFHTEKTPSFFVSPLRQSFYCFGCGAKGDIFSFIEQVEGLDFRGALKLLAERAGVELEYKGAESRTEKDKIFGVLEEATKFFENELDKCEPARRYIGSRGIIEESTKEWRIGYAPAEWRSLHSHLQGLGYDKDLMLKGGLIKKKDASTSPARMTETIRSGGEAYDVFRDRIIFPLFDSNGRVIAFSGRALSKETEPKYLNSPDTPLFTKSEVLYGLDRAKTAIRQKNYAVLVEGQIDLVLSHQAGVRNTVASSGTAFTQAHLERLRSLSSRIILAFDPDLAGEKAALKASILAISLGLEVKVANLPAGLDPAEVVKKNPEDWKNILRESVPAVEFFFNKIEAEEKDRRKLGKLIEKDILPMIKLLRSSIEQSHFISLVAKRTGIKEEVLWDDLKKAKILESGNYRALPTGPVRDDDNLPDSQSLNTKSQKEQIEERLLEIRLWQKELGDKEVALDFGKEEAELTDNLEAVILHDNLNRLLAELSQAEAAKDNKSIESLTFEIQKVHTDIRALDEKKKKL